MTIEFDLKVCVGCGVEVCLVWFGTGLAGCCHSSSRGTGEAGMDQEGKMDGWMDGCMGECFRAERGFESAWEE